jgi:hypothetical protein
LWRLPYTEVLVCHKQQVEVIPSNLSIERSWVPFRCWVSLFLTGFTSEAISGLIQEIWAGSKTEHSNLGPKEDEGVINLIQAIDGADFALLNIISLAMAWING